MLKTSLPALRIRGRRLLPIVQGGMGVGISAHRLAGTVAREGAVGTLASVELRRLHPDIMQRTQRCRDHATLAASNLEALGREIARAREIAGPRGFVAVNVMRALSHYADLVREACAAGADAIVMGAGLPFDLPDLTRGFPDVALIPILSEERGVRAVLKRWMRKGVLPDAIVLEHPGLAGGHLGAPGVDEVDDPKYRFQRVLPAVQAVIEGLGLGAEPIALIPAGGVNSHRAVRELLEMGAGAVQVGTPFAVTCEGDAHPDFKRVLVEARPQDIVTFLSTAGLPARAVLTPWLRRYLAREGKLRARAAPGRARCARNLECLAHCGLKDGNPQAGQFCIETQLAAAQQGDVKRGLFFRGAAPLPFGDRIRPVRELLELLLNAEADGIQAA